MKKIGLLVPNFMIEQCQDFIKGVVKYLKDKDIELVVCHTHENIFSHGMFEYQYWSTFELIKNKGVDVFIMDSTIYSTVVPYESMVEFVKSLGNVPFISYCLNIDLPNVYNVKTECTQIYCDIVKHLKEEHGCKKIAFMSADGTKSNDAIERYEAFKIALKENDFNLDENLVFQGRFTEYIAKQEISKKYTDKSKIDFDAIVSANDSMAIGCIRALEEIGVNVPEDVKVIGFDDSILAKLSSPRLSTIKLDQVFEGETCAKLAEKIINGEKVSKDNFTKLEFVYRQSCGCIPLSNNDMVYKTENEEVISETVLKSDLLEMYQMELAEKYRSTILLNVVNETNTLRQFFSKLDTVSYIMQINSISVFLYKEPVDFPKKTVFQIPDKAELVIYYNRIKKEGKFKPEIVINPQKELYDFNKIDPHNKDPVVLYPIFSGEKNYGYLILTFGNFDFYTNSLNLKMLISFICNTIEYTNGLMETEKLSKENIELQNNNSDLNKQTKTDELTGILNRRGFMEVGQRAIDFIQEAGQTGLVFFADLDGLKEINDTYGHEMGDKAIQLQAKVLQSVFREDDLIGRLGGDEFAIVGYGLSTDNIESIKVRIDEENKRIVKKENLPFKLSISMGAVSLESSSMLPKLLSEADKILYEEKRIKHAKRK